MAAVAHRQGEQPHQASRSRHTGGSIRGEGGVSVIRKRTGTSHRVDAKMIGQWRIGRTIGKGSSGRVKIAKHAITGKYAAIKIVPKGLILTSRMSMSEAGARADKVMLGIEREIVIMKLIDHPNVLNLYDVWETSSELYLIMEYVPGGELFDYLVKRGRLPMSEALHYFQQIIHAVDYCHRFNICHRDLKPENLLLDKDKNIKVADFGMAAWEAGERMLETSCGSPHYASPEIVAGKAYHGSSSDIWSCGIILFALLTGRLPFDDDNIRSLLQKVKVGVFEMPDEIRDPARTLLKRMLEKDPEKRITMPEILGHPFFVSRSPRPIPGRQFVSPPSLDEVERPVNSPAEIDSDIMGNLKTLWSGASEEDIIVALMSKEKTWEKAIYHLLIKYRNKHLENYNMDDDEDTDSAALARRQSKREREPRAIMSSPEQMAQPTSPKSPKYRVIPLRENGMIQELVASSPPARPSAPTPKKAAGMNMDPTSPEMKSPTKLAPPRGPRPPVTARLSYASSTESASGPITPSIVLQEPTPTKGPVAHVALKPRSMADSPTPTVPSTPGVPVPTSSPLNVPTVQDERLQHFFNEVANQLNTMNIRSSVASGSSSSTSAADYHAYMAAYASISGSTSNPVSPIQEEHGELDPNQFADADDDETELGSEYSHAPSSIHSRQASPLIGLGFGAPPPSHGGRPGLYPVPNTPQTQRWSYASSGGSSRHQGDTPSPQPYPSPGWSPQDNYKAVLKASRGAPVPPHRFPTRPAPPPPVSAYQDPTESLLQRDGSYVVIDNADVPASDSSWGSKQSGFSAHSNQDAFGMLKKRKKVSIDPVPYSGELSGPSRAQSAFSSSSSNASSPKRSWFNNLFSFKPPSCILLSHDNVASTRERTKRILGELGVRVAVVEIDGLRALKCRLDEIKDPQGTMTVVKGVRFRVEFARSSPNPNGGYNTLVSLTQEKGAQSSFKGIFYQLRSTIEIETSPAPTTPSPVPTNASDTTKGRPRASHTTSFHYPTSGRVHGPSSKTTPTPSLSAPPMRWTNSEPSTPVMPTASRLTSPVPPSTVQLLSAIRM